MRRTIPRRSLIQWAFPFVRRGSEFGFVPPFPKGSKYFRDPDRSRHATLSVSLRAPPPLPADQKCARCYLEIPKRRSSFRRAERPRLPCFPSPRLRSASINFRGPTPSPRRPKFCDAKLNLGAAGGGPPPYVGECGARAPRSRSLHDVFASSRPRVIFDCDRSAEKQARGRQANHHGTTTTPPPSLLQGSP